MWFLVIFYFIVSLVYIIASKSRSLKDKDYTYDSVGELISVLLFLLFFWWAVIPADLFYFFLREDGKNDINYISPPNPMKVNDSRPKSRAVRKQTP